MAFLIKLGSITVVVPTASEAVDTFDKFVADNTRTEPVISTFDGATIAIDHLRGIVADVAKP